MIAHFSHFVASSELGQPFHPRQTKSGLELGKVALKEHYDQ